MSLCPRVVLLAVIIIAALVAVSVWGWLIDKLEAYLRKKLQ